MRTGKVAVAMSGGVDSAVAAYLLSEKGYETVGITMCLGVADRPGSKVKCCGPQEIEDARRVCHLLEIPHYVMDFSRELEDRVIAPFVREYQRGRTPNPCVDCNQHIKFGSLMDKVLAMGFAYLATGHYAAIVSCDGKLVMAVSRDRRKDQTYFLHSIRKDVLGCILFPLGGYTKDAVREIARNAGLTVSDKQESQDICFIAEEGYGAFLRSRSIEVNPGEFVDREGNILGTHRGYALYTTGQRARLGGWSGKPLYVLGIDARKNRVVVGGKADLMAPGLAADRVNLLVDDLPERCVAKIRYAHRGAACRVALDGDQLRVVFDEPQEAITPGQHVVLYDGGIVLGGGIIREVLH